MGQKVALITGTSRALGLGFAVARQLAELDYHVILSARDATRAEPLAHQLRHRRVRGHGTAPGRDRSGQHPRSHRSAQRHLRPARCTDQQR
ncbi:SDR family NAD(P)-dependent oxidoreductase [Mycolicibacterium pallens]|uniref:SDR family NAD(P)-dependent oxidoreductase n=1 Tax=Mycolicibacterium pallens TaxID=370524 RepID=UPI003313B186